MCQKEVTLARSLKKPKPIIPLLFESLPEWPPAGPLGIPFTGLLRINMSETLDSAGNFPEEKLQELFHQVRKLATRGNQ